MTSNRALDITGEVYGKLTAISRTSNKNNNGCYIWLFKCSCGEEVLRDIGNLRFRRDCACCKSCKQEQLPTGCPKKETRPISLGLKLRRGALIRMTKTTTTMVLLAL